MDNEILRRLEGIDPDFRLGTKFGRRFMLVKLMPIRKLSLAPLLELSLYRGRLLGRPYDTATQLPIMLEDITAEQLSSGDVLRVAKEWKRSAAEKRAEASASTRSQTERMVDETAEEAVDRRMFDLRHGADRGERVAKKFLSKRDKAILTGDDYSARTASDVLAEHE